MKYLGNKYEVKVLLPQMSKFKRLLRNDKFDTPTTSYSYLYLPNLKTMKVKEIYKGSPKVGIEYLS